MEDQREPEEDSLQQRNLEESSPYNQMLALSGGESLISRLGGMILAKAYLPTGAHVKQALAYMDIGIKLEIVLYELQLSLFVMSYGELLLFLLGFIMFISDSTEMRYFWLHIAHIPRGALGILLRRSLPKSH